MISMRQFLHLIIMCMVALIFAVSCELEKSDNGNLDGYWQWTLIDTIATGGTCNMKESLIFWGVESDILEIFNNKTNNENIIFRFKHNGDTLILSNPIIDIRDSSDIIMTNYSLLENYGIYDIPETLFIDFYGSNHITFSNRLFHLYLRKY